MLIILGREVAERHMLGITCNGLLETERISILRLTIKKRMRATLLSIRIALNRHRPEPVQVVGRWLGSVAEPFNLLIAPCCKPHLLFCAVGLLHYLLLFQLKFSKDFGVGE